MTSIILSHTVEKVPYFSTDYLVVVHLVMTPAVTVQMFKL